MRNDSKHRLRVALQRQSAGPIEAPNLERNLHSAYYKYNGRGTYRFSDPEPLCDLLSLLDTHSFPFSNVCDSVRSHLGSAVPRRGQHRFIGTCTYTTHGHGVSWREEDSVGNRICGGRRRHGYGIEDVYDVMTA